MDKKLVSKVLIGIMLTGSIIAGNKADTQAEAHKNALNPIPESVLIID